MSTLRDEGFKLLKHRVARMQRLLVLEKVPDIIIVMEARLIARAAQMMDIEAWNKWDAEEKIRDWKRGLGVCIHEDCDSPVKRPREIDTKITSWEEYFEKDHCAEHTDEFSTEARAFDNDEGID